MGSKCASTLASDVDAVLITDIDAGRLAVTAAEVERSTDAKVHSFVGDIGAPAFATELAAQADALGELHSVVQTAGLSPSMAAWRDILNIDLVAVARVLDAFHSLVVPGSVAVCVSSISGHMGDFDTAMDAVLDTPLAADFVERFHALAGEDPDAGATYRLAKHGVLRLCELAAVTWGSAGGRVVSVSPGLIDTEMGRLELQHHEIKKWMAKITPVGTRVNDADTVLPGRIDDIAEAVAFVCSPRASFISGCDLRVDGGLLAAMSHQEQQS
jgi:NAD(P)-dependent dehydrogenase (short-subunit alcohol dehydrogenase family)